jgi:hypothetical protein
MLYICKLESLKGRYVLGETGIGGRIILKLILKKSGLRVWTGLVWFRLHSEHGRDPKGSVKLVVACSTWLSSLSTRPFGGGEGPLSRCCGRTAALRLIVQPCDEDD